MMWIWVRDIFDREEGHRILMWEEVDIQGIVVLTESGDVGKLHCQEWNERKG